MPHSVHEQFLVITALGHSPILLTSILCQAATESRCALTSTRLTRHGKYSALVLQATGNWDALARLETGLPQLARRHEFIINCVRSTPLPSRPQALPYVVYVNAVYRPGILNELCQFFVENDIELENITYDTYQAPHTGSTMLNGTLTVTLPAGTQINWLRDQFLDFADALNLDALIEPWRPHSP